MNYPWIALLSPSLQKASIIPADLTINRSGY